MNALNQAIRLIGGPSKTARLLGVTPQAVCFWRDGVNRFPAEHCPSVERAVHALGGNVRCEDLRPDVDWGYLRGIACLGPATKCNQPAPA